MLLIWENNISVATLRGCISVRGFYNIPGWKLRNRDILYDDV